MLEFHAMDEDVKKKLYRNQYNPENINFYFGYIPLIDNDPSHKEFFDMGTDYSEVSEEEKRQCLMEETPFPTDERYTHLKERYIHHYNQRHSIGMKLIGMIAQGLGKEKEFFNDWFEKDSLSILRTIKYTARKDSHVKTDKLDKNEFRLVTPPHTDSGFITILTTFGYPGLQVLIDDEYKSVKPMKNHLVVNLGLTFQHITNNKLKATYH